MAHINPRTGKMAGTSDLVDIECEVRHDTGDGRANEGALLLWDGSREAWVPNSMCQNNGDGTVTMPKWKAKEVGFI